MIGWSYLNQNVNFLVCYKNICTYAIYIYFYFVLIFSASAIGLDTIHGQVLSGDQIDAMSEHQLEQIVNNVTVFYRVTPRHKLCIVKVSIAGRKSSVSANNSYNRMSKSIYCCHRFTVCVRKAFLIPSWQEVLLGLWCQEVLFRISQFHNLWP